MYLRSLLLLSALISCNTSYAALFDDEDERKKYRAGQQEQSRLQEARIVKLEEVTHQAIIGLHNQIEELRREFSKLNGQIEVLANDIQLSQNRQKDFYIDLDSRLRRIEQPVVGSDTDSSVVEGAPVAPVAVAAVAAVVPVPVASDTVATDAENGDYQEAFNMFKIGRFKGAISKFKSFIENYPTSKLLPSSHYWIGNSHYAMRDFKRAIYVQQELVKDFPDSVKVPDAMLNIASSQKEINYTTASQKTLKDLITKYPISEAAKKAKLRLVD